MPVQNRKFDYYYLDAINFCDDLFMFFFFLVLFRSLRPATLLKMRLWHRCFLVNFAKFPNTLFLFYFKKIRMRRLLSTNNISTGIRTTFFISSVDLFFRINTRRFCEDLFQRIWQNSQNLQKYLPIRYYIYLQFSYCLSSFISSSFTRCSQRCCFS